MIYLNKAAESGNGDAQLLLGLIFHKGDGVILNHVVGQMWLNIASVGGNQIALIAQTVNRLGMKPQQIADAKRLSEEWIKRHNAALRPSNG